MRSMVDSDLTTCSEAFLTVVAFEWHLTGVDAQMAIQGARRREILKALRTTVLRLAATVRFDVLLEHLQFGATPRAFVADVTGCGHLKTGGGVLTAHTNTAATVYRCAIRIGIRAGAGAGTGARTIRGDGTIRTGILSAIFAGRYFTINTFVMNGRGGIMCLHSSILANLSSGHFLWL